VAVFSDCGTAATWSLCSFRLSYRVYIMLATRHLLPLMRCVDYTTGLHTMGAPYRLAVTFCASILNIFRMKAPMQIEEDVTLHS